MASKVAALAADIAPPSFGENRWHLLSKAGEGGTNIRRFGNAPAFMGLESKKGCDESDA
ncbi:MAG: hypothetical protein JRJ12_12795 [Deltaproteobacteria bacterium]|nr:hypothetical protein [Deltaproteobacteria bacterium]MBW2072089.1 hypothetical protein [Deltaproteobacteria bacterium]